MRRPTELQFEMYKWFDAKPLPMIMLEQSESKRWST